MLDFIPILVTILAFGAIAAVVFVVGQQLSIRAQMRRRLPAVAASDAFGAGRLGSFIAERLDEERLGVDSELRVKLRRRLVRAGVFSDYAVKYYAIARLATVAALPTISFMLSELFIGGLGWQLQILMVATSGLVAIFGPDAYLARRQRILATRYRQVFPDVLDLLVVCVDAGLSLEAALARVRTELGNRSREMVINLEVMGAEMRAGRSTVEALDSLGDRLGIDEAAVFTSVLRQSVELGSDVGEALRIFSDEMRDKRMLRAEEAANKLPVKMVLPLGGFIFPVILIMILFPIVIKLLGIFQHL